MCYSVTQCVALCRVRINLPASFLSVLFCGLVVPVFVQEIDMKSQRSGMYAFVQFNDMTSACRAKALMNGELIGRSYCKVGFGHRVVTHTLWIGGISPHVSDADVARKCSRFGTVLEVAVNPAQKAALVHFDCKDSAVNAADELRGKIFHSSRLKVCFLPDL